MFRICAPDAEVEHVNPSVEANGGEHGAGVGGPRYAGHLKEQIQNRYTYIQPKTDCLLQQTLGIVLELIKL